MDDRRLETRVSELEAELAEATSNAGKWAEESTNLEDALIRSKSQIIELRAALTASEQARREANAHWQADWGKEHRRANAAESAAAEMREALAPFALKDSPTLRSLARDDEVVFVHTAAIEIPLELEVGDLRRAARLCAQGETKKETSDGA